MPSYCEDSGREVDQEEEGWKEYGHPVNISEPQELSDLEGEQGDLELEDHKSRNRFYLILGRSLTLGAISLYLFLSLNLTTVVIMIANVLLQARYVRFSFISRHLKWRDYKVTEPTYHKHKIKKVYEEHAEVQEFSLFEIFHEKSDKGYKWETEVLHNQRDHEQAFFVVFYNLQQEEDNQQDEPEVGRAGLEVGLVIPERVKVVSNEEEDRIPLRVSSIDELDQARFFRLG